MHLVDTHCHLTNRRFADDLPAVLARAAAAGVGRMLTVGTGLDDARRGAELAAAHPDRVLRAAGLDPFTCHALGDGFPAALVDLAEHLRGGGCVALGEVGLEYHHPLLPPAAQADRLTDQLVLAAEMDLPVILHVRDAHADALRLLAGFAPLRGVVHAFSADAAAARAYCALGLHLGLGGMVTYKGNERLREAAAAVPPDRLLLETDAPYLAPQPRRGRRCEPAFVADTCRLLAGELGLDPADLAARTGANAAALFGVGP